MRAAKKFNEEWREMEPPSSPEDAGIFGNLLSRKEKWERFDQRIARSQEAAPAFVEEITVGGLWSIQKLVRSKVRAFSKWHRLRNDPPQYGFDCGECYYNGWPGDHRGWMRFQTKEEAVNFYKFAEKLMSFEEYRKRPHGEMSTVRYDLDDNGDIVIAENM